MTVFEIIVTIISSITLLLVLYLLFRKQESVDFKGDLDKSSSELKIQLVKDQGEIKEHLATQIGSNNEKMLTMYNDFSKSLVENLNKEQSALKEHLAKEIGSNNEKMLTLYNNFEKSLKESLDKSIKELNEKVDLRLNDGFKKTNETFQGILERISKIDEAQKKIEQLSTNIISLQDILSDKKSRGCFGEVQLYSILASIFGEKNDKVYQLQYKLPNGTQVDSIIFCPNPLGHICIDSKFPLENYQRMMDRTLSEVERNNYTKMFKSDVKKHIDAIADKYIIKDVTADQAILFLPAEAIFAEINAYHQDLVEYSQKKRIWLTGPTTLMATLTTIEVILRNIERDKHAKEIQNELAKLSVEFGRYRSRWDKLSNTIKTVSKEVDEINTTTVKISNKFESIHKVELDIEDEPKLLD
jgi:DNA recombination protein RmuC